MPTPYPDPFSGLAQGLQQGFTMGLARRQQALAEQEQAQKIEIEKQKALKESIFKGLETGQNLMKIKHPAIRQKGLDITMKTIRDNADFFGIDPTSLPETINWTDSFDPVVKEIDEGMKAYKEGRIDDATALGALNASLMKARDIMDSEDVEVLRKGKEAELKAMQGERESSMLQQAAMIPSLTKQGVLSPEEAQAGQLTALAGAGTKGQEVLTGSLKKEEKQEDFVETTVNGVPVKLPASVYVAHIDREAQREQNKINHQENLALRAQLAEISNGFRSRLPAAKAQQLGEKEQKLDRYASLIKNFDDAFGGKIAFGPFATKVHERLGSDKERVDWWKNFNELDSLIRNQLFGATLTGYELENWKSQTVNENTDPAIIRQRLQDRLNWATGAYQREIGSYEQAGYSSGKQGGKPQSKTKSKFQIIEVK